MRSRLHASSRVALSCIVFLCACHHSAPAPTPTPMVATNSDSIRAARERADARARADAARRDSLARANAREDSLRRANELARLNEDARKALLAPVHFDFDRDQIRSDDIALLGQKIAILGANPGLKVRIEGNADDRGSDEYNLALGMRRAAAVQRYLQTHGVASDRLTVSSNGEERPLCPGQGESCWGENRRDDVVVVAGGDHIIAVR